AGTQGVTDHRKGLLPGFTVRHHEIGLVEIDGVDLVAIYKLDNVEAFRRLEAEFLQVFGIDGDIAVLRDLEALHDILVFDRPASFDDLLIADALAATLVDLVKTH